MTTKKARFIQAFGALTLLVLLEAIPAEARRGGFRGHGFAGPRIGFVAPFGGFYGFRGGFYSPYFYSFHGGPYLHGRYRGPEGGMNLTQARLMGWGAIDLNVKPGKAEVWVNGQYLGTARDFDGHPTYLWLKEGEHEVTIYRGGFETYEENVSITPGQVIKLKLKLEQGESQPPQPAVTTQGSGPKA